MSFGITVSWSVLHLLLPPSACSASGLWLSLVLRAPSTCSASVCALPLVLGRSCSASCLWSQTSTTPASNLAPQTTSTIVNRNPRYQRSLLNNRSASCMCLPLPVSEPVPLPASDTAPLLDCSCLLFSLCVLCKVLIFVNSICYSALFFFPVFASRTLVITSEFSQVALSLDNEGDVEASKEGLDIPDDYTIWNEVVTKEKKKAAFGLDLYSKLDSRNCSETSKDNLNIEQELHMWKEKAKEQEMINEEKKVKLNDAEHKLKDQGRQLKAQQKRIGSTEKTLHALYKKLNLPRPSTMYILANDELGTGSNDDEDDNMSD
ncbi:hypothetical protein Ahy_B04g073093 [Arachis hypogaea]|uniref:Uncharacterized protein n=1 Tax=Arachis hypogaea TaxID=3818 RepID=A0A444ZPP4_ARAHY|nr:hypothetical protein Ahy_B04g073093 [Arachis hypogaea]